jgi:hypothetical protein
VTITYPAALPHPLKEGYAFEPENNILRTQMQSGRARQRQSFTSVPSYAQLSWILDDQQAQLFEAWSAQVAGAAWFDITLRTPLGLFDQQVRFMTSVVGPRRIGVRHWGYNVRAELRDRAVVAPDWAEILPGYILLSDIFDLAMNREWPEFVFDYANYAAALADFDSLSSGQRVSVKEDEQNSGQASIYSVRKTTGYYLNLNFENNFYGVIDGLDALVLEETWQL